MNRYREYMVRITLDSEDELHRQIENLAKTKGVSVEMMVESLVCMGVYHELKRKVDLLDKENNKDG